MNFGIKKEVDINMEKQYRFKNEELAHLEQNIYRNPYKRYDGEVSNIKLFLRKDPYSQMENISNQIIRTC